jgi:hypothetical protein
MLYEPTNSKDMAFAKDLNKNYIEFLGKYYGDYANDFTVHAHLHLVDQVEQHSPLKTHSQFVLEVLSLILNNLFINRAH